MTKNFAEGVFSLNTGDVVYEHGDLWAMYVASPKAIHVILKDCLISVVTIPEEQSLAVVLEEVKELIHSRSERLNNMDNLIIDWDYVRSIVGNNEQLVETEGHQDNCITFEFHGTCVYDPFHDESLRFSVEPIEYYGQYFIASDFIR